MEITDLKTLLKENNLNEKELSKLCKDFNRFMNLTEIVAKKEFVKKIPKELKDASPVFTGVITEVFNVVRKAYNEVHNI